MSSEGSIRVEPSFALREQKLKRYEAAVRAAAEPFQTPNVLAYLREHFEKNHFFRWEFSSDLDAGIAQEERNFPSFRTHKTKGD